MRPSPFHGGRNRTPWRHSGGGAALPAGHSALAEEANAAFLESMDAFGRAAVDELARSGVDRRTIKANVVALHRQRRAEVKRIAEAFGRRCATKEDHDLLRFALGLSLENLDWLYKKFRRGANILHERG